MLVTPIGRKFGKHQPGDVFELRDKTANLLIKVGKLAEARSQTYQTRDMQPAAVSLTRPVELNVVLSDDDVWTSPVDETVSEASEEAPWGYKTDGTPRKRPGRAPSSE